MKKNTKEKIKLKKSYKKAVTILLIVLLLLNLALLSKEVFAKQYIEEKKIVYSCVNLPSVTYGINLIPNLIYDVEHLDEEEGYFASLVDTVSVEISDEFKGVTDAVLEGEYEVTYRLTGMVTGSNEPVVAWEKRFVEVPKKAFYTTEKNYNVQESFHIDFNYYKDFAEQVTDLIVFTTDNYLNVDLNINYTITTEDGVIKNNMKPGLIIPLGQDYFKIEKSGLEKKDSEITETIKVLAPTNYRMVALYIVLSLILLIILIFIIKYTTEPDMVDLKRKHTKKVFKQYGKRLVAIEQDMLKNIKARNMVHSINDMEKISDELEKPIFYIHRDDLSDINELFILDGEEAFICNIELK